MYAREAERFELADDSISVDGVQFRSQRLRNTLKDAEAHSVILVAVGAGPEAEEEARRRWADDKPDEYFFLEVYASAVVEHLTTLAGARLCDWAEQRQMAVLPHYSPGYPEWDIQEQPRFLDLLKRTRSEVISFLRRSVRLRHAAAQEDAVGGIRADAAHGSTAKAHNPCSLRALLVWSVPVPARAVPQSSASRG